MDDHRSIQDIIPPARSKPIRQPVSGGANIPPPTPPQPMNLKPEKSNLATFVFIAAGIIVVAGIGIGVISTVFHRAYVTVTPYVFNATIEETLQTTPGSTVLPYQKVSVTDTATKSVSATGTSHVENHAAGTITVYNSYTTTSQRFITNTRFTSAAGLVYRIHTPITIPGYTTKAGLKVPGSVDVLVYADEAGEKYNTDLTQFTIPGLKGSKQYTLMTARSKTPMTGGFIGEQAVVDPTVRSQTVDALKADLNRSLRAKISSATVAGTVMFADSIVVTYTENPDTVQGGNASISVSGQAAAPAFSGTALARQFADTAGVSYGGPLAVKDPSTLTVHVDPADALGTDKPISVSIAGSATLLSTFDQTALVKDLAGKNKKDIQSVLPSYAGISTIDVKIYPFWLSGLPSNEAQVSITVVDTAPKANP